MLFNSLEFIIFLPIVFLIYWGLLKKNLKLQNGFLILASYIFYGWWDWRFLSLIIISSGVDYVVGLSLSKYKYKSRRKLLLYTSIFVNLGFLGVFKYCNFFIENFIEAFSVFGITLNVSSLNIILPVGISFYTFQTLSYTIDVYRNKLKPTSDALSFFAYVSFFPQLVAGPIERATNLLPQFYKHRKFVYTKAVDGMRQILWGLFKKVVIADNCAFYVNDIFKNYEVYSGSTLLLGAIFFAFQIYGDFSGYSDIAIGTARLFGFNLKRNFAFPYFSRDIAEFWRRWHISLSSWFKDYVYIPLGGSRGSKLKKVRNIFIIFLVSGLWHGANWTFLAWGLINACLFLPLLLINKNRINTNTVAENRLLPTIKEFLQMAITFLFVVMAWVFFRSEDLTQAFNYLSIIFSDSIFNFPETRGVKETILIIVLVIVEWFQRTQEHGLQFDKIKLPTLLRWSIYYAVGILIFLYSGSQTDFIYFQF